MKIPPVRMHRASRRGFTLIEIMVATVIMVILVGLVIQITSEVLKVWNRSSGKLAANAEARIAMELLTQDIETAVFRNNGQQWLRVESSTDVGSPVVGKTVALNLFSPALDRSGTVGDICAIAYKLAYDKSYDGANAPKTYALYRSIAAPDFTFNSLMGPGTGDPQLALTGGSFWSSTSVIVPENFLASNVVDFRVLVYGVDSSGNEVILNDADRNGSIDANFIFGGAGDIGVNAIYADIILKIISDEGMQVLENNKVAQSGLSLDEFITANSETFTRRVNFLARPL